MLKILQGGVSGGFIPRGLFPLFFLLVLSGPVHRAEGAPPGDVVTKVIVVRHAEKDTAGTNPHLTEAGKERARMLARMLADEPVTALVSSDRARTIETLGPLSEFTLLPVTIVPVKNGREEHAADLADSIRARAGGTIVVSNHSDVIPILLRELGVEEEVAIPDSEYGRIFIVFLDSTRSTVFFRLRYGS